MLQYLIVMSIFGFPSTEYIESILPSNCTVLDAQLEHVLSQFDIMRADPSFEMNGEILQEFRDVLIEASSIIFDITRCSV